MFYNAQGNYCPNSRDCIGAKYVQADFNKYLPVSDARVYIYESAMNTLIGQGITDSGGHFTIRWDTFFYNIPMYIRWRPIQKDGRFAIRTPSGGQWNFNTGLIQPDTNTTLSSPQILGAFYWGSSSSPEPVSNLYNGAWRMWYYALNSSSRMRAYFNDVEIRADSDKGGKCPTSCANGGQNRIDIDSVNSMYAPQARILHEMGHIASYRASYHQNYKYGGDYEWPNTGKNGSWSLTSSEWGAAQFEEGLATFYGDRAIYWQAATEPHTCYASKLPCSNGSYNTESSSGAGSGCAFNEDRFPISVVRYLRDLYDSNGDTGISASYSEFFETIEDFPGGISNGDKDEPFCDSAIPFMPDYLCDRHGRSARDFRRHFEARTGENTLSEWAWNCVPVGD
ncbi:hypothetical protein [Bradymonas sediminis]|uniref:hypothetical protein n=1 Tax=Bradymonas sediminis TaxID=1548548 RepID=UPI00105E65C4|nr:hypothetical protein [Bradymonas sediminis]TDP77406.1 hypothetical protein DFR33_101306 [Bradymonas sediminis]